MLTNTDCSTTIAQKRSYRNLWAVFAVNLGVVSLIVATSIVVLACAYELKQRRIQLDLLTQQLEMQFVPMLTNNVSRDDLQGGLTLLQIINELPHVGSVWLSNHGQVYKGLAIDYQDQRSKQAQAQTLTFALSNTTEQFVLGVQTLQLPLWQIAWRHLYGIGLPAGIATLLLGLVLLSWMRRTLLISLQPLLFESWLSKQSHVQAAWHVGVPVRWRALDSIYKRVNYVRSVWQEQTLEIDRLREQRLQTKTQLRSQRQRLKTLLSNVEQPVVLTDEHFKIKSLNPAAIKLDFYYDALVVDADLTTVLMKNAAGLETYADLQLRINESVETHTALELKLFASRQQSIIIRMNCGLMPSEGERAGYFFSLLDITASNSLTAELEDLAYRDSLTGALNQVCFEQIAPNFIHPATASIGHSDVGAVLLYINIDQFRLVNDCTGRSGGDQLLRMVADTIKTQLAPDDLVVRLESDIFVVVKMISSVHLAHPESIEFMQTLQNLPFACMGHDFTIHCSLGAVMLPTPGLDTDQVLDLARDCCERARQHTVNRIEFLKRDIWLGGRNRRKSAEGMLELERAIVDHRLKLFLEPIVPLDDHAERMLEGTPTGGMFEVLVRLHASNGQMLLPGKYIKSAEQYQKMMLLDSYVVQELFAFIAQHQQWFSGIKQLCINLSGQSLNEYFMFELVLAEAKKHNIDTTRICFEVTETVAIQDLEQSTTIIARLRAHGFQFSLDDFGAGAASFAYLQNLPVNFLKIDGSFVRKICQSTVDHHFVRSINDVAHQQGIETIAEFVENTDILNEVTQMHVNYAQGHVYGQAMPIEAFVEHA